MGFSQERARSFAELDPRMKLLLVLIFTTATFMSQNSFILIWNYALILLIYAGGSGPRSVLKTGLILGALLASEVLVGTVPHESTKATLGLIVFMLQRTAVFFLMGAWMASRLKISDFLTAMQNMRIPKGVTITLAVFFRYLPTVKEELRSITNTMKLRGIGLSAKNILRHPLKTSEYAVVPLVIRSLTISDELAASAMTRGLDLENERTSYRKVCLRWRDILYTALVISAVVAGLTINAVLHMGVTA